MMRCLVIQLKSKIVIFNLDDSVYWLNIRLAIYVFVRTNCRVGFWTNSTVSLMEHRRHFFILNTTSLCSVHVFVVSVHVECVFAKLVALPMHCFGRYQWKKYAFVYLIAVLFFRPSSKFLKIETPTIYTRCLIRNGDKDFFHSFHLFSRNEDYLVLILCRYSCAWEDLYAGWFDGGKRLSRQMILFAVIKHKLFHFQSYGNSSENNLLEPLFNSLQWPILYNSSPPKIVCTISTWSN